MYILEKVLNSTVVVQFPSSLQLSRRTSLVAFKSTYFATMLGAFAIAINDVLMNFKLVVFLS